MPAGCSTRNSKDNADVTSSCLGCEERQRLEDRITKAETENAIMRKRLEEIEVAYAIIQANHMSTASLDSLEREEKLTARTLEAKHFFLGDDPTKDYNEIPTYPDRPHYDKATSNPATKLVVFDGCPNDPNHPSSVPIYQTATFVQPGIGEFGPYDYTRSGNPTRTAVETLVGQLEGGAAFAFASGMAALQTLMTTLKAGDAVVTGTDLYGGMHRLLTRVTSHLGVEVIFIETWDTASVEKVLKEKNGVVKLVHLESPTNPLMRVVDVRAICDLAHSHGALVSIDNTMMSPLRSTPLALGCDFVVHSATKFFAGHSDVTAGLVCCSKPALSKQIAFLQNAQGNALAPFDCWLLLRGMKTMSIRLDRQEMNAMAVAIFLARQTAFVKKIYYVGLDPSSPQTETPSSGESICGHTKEMYVRHFSQCTGPGSVISFETGCAQLSRNFVKACRLFKITVSFGSCNSLIEMPCLLSHASIPAEERTLPEDLVRLSIGIEQIEDILSDLQRAIASSLSIAGNGAH